MSILRSATNANTVAQQITISLDQGLKLWARLAGDGEFSSEIEGICNCVIDALRRGNQLLAFGNGGSATDAMHLTEELVGRFSWNRQPFPAICLSADSSSLTCIANDFGFDQVFSRPLHALCHSGDVVVAFSTSGQSANIVRALETARARGAITIGFLGKDGGAARALCTHKIVVPHDDTARIQEVHTLCLHLICEAVDRSDLAVAYEG